MLKKIAIEELRIGMFVQELCGRWIDNPFWKSSMIVEDAKQLKLLQHSGIREVWIDSGRGRDVELLRDEGAVPDSALLFEAAKEARMQEVVTRKLGFLEELEQAKHIHQRSRGVINGLMSEGRMGVPLSLTEAKRVVDEVTMSVMRNSDALVSLLHQKTSGNYFYMHALSVCALMVALGRQLAFDDVLLRRVGLAGLLMDVGKAFLPDGLLNEEGPLRPEAREQMQTHTRLGYDWLIQSGVTDELVLDVCLHHHERPDGLGYPDRLSSQISQFSAMAAICDVYDALTSDRGYQMGCQPNQAVRRMAEWQKEQFDSRIFHAFVRTVGLYPSGTLVRLKSGRLAKVLEQSEKNLTSPVVKMFFSIRQNAFVEPEVMDLTKTQDAVASAEDPAKWGWQKIPL